MLNRSERAVVATITDLVESMGGTVECSKKPVHATAPSFYPHVAATVDGKTFTAHRATFTLCHADLEAWLLRL